MTESLTLGVAFTAVISVITCDAACQILRRAAARGRVVAVWHLRRVARGAIVPAAGATFAGYLPSGPHVLLTSSSRAIGARIGSKKYAGFRRTTAFCAVGYRGAICLGMCHEGAYGQHRSAEPVAHRLHLKVQLY